MSAAARTRSASAPAPRRQGLAATLLLGWVTDPAASGCDECVHDSLWHSRCPSAQASANAGWSSWAWTAHNLIIVRRLIARRFGRQSVTCTDLRCQALLSPPRQLRQQAFSKGVEKALPRSKETALPIRAEHSQQIAGSNRPTPVDRAHRTPDWPATRYTRQLSCAGVGLAVRTHRVMDKRATQWVTAAPAASVGSWVLGGLSRGRGPTAS
jgi:hypothetical protein